MFSVVPFDHSMNHSLVTTYPLGTHHLDPTIEKGQSQVTHHIASMRLVYHHAYPLQTCISYSTMYCIYDPPGLHLQLMRALLISCASLGAIEPPAVSTTPTHKILDQSITLVIYSQCLQTHSFHKPNSDIFKGFPIKSDEVLLLFCSNKVNFYAGPFLSLAPIICAK